MVSMVRAVTSVEFPAMRYEVVQALATLADPDYQRRAWLEKRFDRPGSYEDLNMNVHTLYDDTEVLPNPRDSIGTILTDGPEIEALEALAVPYSVLLDRLGDAEPSQYLNAPEWPDVIRAASVALASMVRAGY